MLNLTPSAINRFKKILADNNVEHYGIRIFQAGDGCCGTPGLGLDAAETPENGDMIIEKDGLKIYVDGSITELLDNAVIDYSEGSGFSISGLPRSSECGSGACN